MCQNNKEKDSSPAALLNALRTGGAVAIRASSVCSGGTPDFTSPSRGTDPSLRFADRRKTATPCFGTEIRVDNLYNLDNLKNPPNDMFARAAGWKGVALLCSRRDFQIKLGDGSRMPYRNP